MNSIYEYYTDKYVSQRKINKKKKHRKNIGSQIISWNVEIVKLGKTFGIYIYRILSFQIIDISSESNKLRNLT